MLVGAGGIQALLHFGDEFRVPGGEVVALADASGDVALFLQYARHGELAGLEDGASCRFWWLGIHMWGLQGDCINDMLPPCFLS